MRKISEGVYTWSVFNQEKELNFNGLFLQLPSGNFLVDPPALSAEDVAQIESLGAPVGIYLTNKHHTREAQAHRQRWGARIWVPEDDQALMEIPVDGTYSDGELLAEELEAIRIPGAKTPGECAFHWPKKKILIVGDAIISKPEGLVLLPDDKFKDPVLARLGLRVLRGLDYDILCVGDGEPLLKGASVIVEKFLEQLNPA